MITSLIAETQRLRQMSTQLVEGYLKDLAIRIIPNRYHPLSFDNYENGDAIIKGIKDHDYNEFLYLGS